jgi:hypothetical protein
MRENLAVLQGTEMITSLLYRYAIFENVYLHNENPLPAEIRGQVERVVKDVYMAVLIFLLKARKHGKQRAWSMFRPYFFDGA